MKKLFAYRPVSLVFCALMLAACQTPVTTTTNTVNQTTVTTVNSNVNANSVVNVNSNSTTTVTTTGGTTIETNEPQQYQGTVTLTAEAGGNDKKTMLPKITAQVARSGDDRRMEFTLPNGEKIIYLDLGGRQLIVSPARKQYAELNKESLGIDVRRLLTPAQIVAQIKALKGVEKVGEEKYNGRDAVKYQYSAVTQTKTNAGNVDTNSVIYVDKETNLPLHSETSSMSENGAVNGLNNLRLVTEMSNIQTSADSSLFAEPTGYEKVAPEQIHQQLQALFNVVGTFIGQMMQQAQTAPSPAPTATPR